ncbi:MAG: acyl carrier protein [Nitrospirae bacterium]|nr:acyl carrier protein [Nitrospirota bacterium]
MKEQIREFIIKTFMSGEGSIKDDENLFDSGIIDSLGLIKLLAFIGEKLKISVDMSDVTMDKFSSVNNIMKTLESKMHN